METEQPKQRRAKGEGSVYQRTLNGVKYWQAAQDVEVQSSEPGAPKTRKRVTGTGTTRAEALRRLQGNLRRFYERGAPEPQKRPQTLTEPLMTVEGWCYDWLARLAAAGAPSETVQQKYRRALELHVLPSVGFSPIGELTFKDCAHLIETTLPGKTKPNGERLLSSGGIANIYKPFNLALRDAVNRGVIDRNPLAGVRQPRHQRKDEYVNEHAKYAGYLLQALENHPDQARYILPFLGLRRSERLGLTWNKITNLDSDDGKARMRVEQQLARYVNGDGYYIKKQLKTEASKRTLPIPEPFLTALRREKQKQEKWKQGKQWNQEDKFRDLVFTTETGKPITQNVDNETWRKLLRELELPQWRGHLNRHITATLLARQVVPISVVKEILGHNSEAMTTYYQELDPQMMVEPLTVYGTNMMNEAKEIDKKLREMSGGFKHWEEKDEEEWEEIFTDDGQEEG